jgi:hypothetical protein
VTLEIASQPPGAELWVGQEAAPRGRTPLELRLAAHAPAAHAQLRAPGRAPVDLMLDPRVTHPLTVVLPPAAAPPTPKAHAEPSPPARHRSRDKKSGSSGEFKAIED